MHVDPAETSSVNASGANELQDFPVFRHLGLRQRGEQVEEVFAIGQGAAREFPDDERMTEHRATTQQRGEFVILVAQVVYPDRRVRQDHRPPDGRRREMGRKSFSLPPRAASRRALSRAINACSPCRTREVFSSTPVSRAACRINSSSMWMVVLICMSMHDPYARVSHLSLQQTVTGASSLTRIRTIVVWNRLG